MVVAHWLSFTDQRIFSQKVPLSSRNLPPGLSGHAGGGAGRASGSAVRIGPNALVAIGGRAVRAPSVVRRDDSGGDRLLLNRW